MAIIRNVTEDDINYVSTNMREIDKEECAAAYHTPEEALRLSIDDSHWVYTAVTDEGRPALIFGLCSIGPVGVPWALGTEDIQNMKTPLIRMCRDVVDEWMFRDFDILSNLVSVKNTVHRKWLEFCGFQMGNYSHCLGPNNLEMLQFIKVRN